MSYRKFLNLFLLVAFLGFVSASGAPAQQVPLNPTNIPQFVDPLPLLDLPTSPPGLPYSMAVADGTLPLTITMCEFTANILPAGTKLAKKKVYAGTKVWGYIVGNTCPTNAQDTYIGPVIIAERGTATKVKWVNNLGSTTTTGVVAWKNATDQTLHWADPLNQGHQMTNYVGPIPAVVHLHGGEVPPQLDGGPDAWFLSTTTTPAGYTQKGHGYYTSTVFGDTAALNEAIYRYPNTQEAAFIWFHDHVLGITRLNVYAGLAGAYALVDPAHTLPAGLHPLGMSYGTTGDPPVPTLGEPIIPLVIQDRQFDVNGELFFDPMGINPEHPFWVPEFVGDVIVVNGKAWPVLNVQKKRYRFLFLNGSNARAYELDLFDKVTGLTGPRMWVIGTDGGYLDTPVPIDPALKQKLIIMPGERYDVIIDFADPNWVTPSGTLLMRNTARTPYPGGATVQGRTTARVMQIVVGAAPGGGDNSFDPSAGGTPLNAIRRLPGTPGGPVIDKTTTGNVQLTRQLTLNEFMGPGGPLEVLVNNTKWGGHSIHEAITHNAVSITAAGVRNDFILDPSGNSDTYYSELPKEGDTELWEIINLTADAHPIHLHLVQFQLVNRQPFNFKTYNALYDSLFPATTTTLDPMTGVAYPGGVFIGGYGPPNPYGAANTDGAVGGNPPISAHLLGLPLPPLPQEEGWKDTVIMYPGEVTRIMVRWAPTDLLLSTPVANLYFPFDPNGGHGYVWHCHIIDHEDNEMMRPTSVVLNPYAPEPFNRPLSKGSRY